MFLCEDCAHPDDKWYFNMAMSLSKGPCENCGYTRLCTDHKGAKVDPNWRQNLADSIRRAESRRANA